MNAIWQIIVEEFTAEIPDARSLIRASIRLTLALVLSACIGFERERGGKSAGLRTHILVGLGSALFVLALDQNNDAEISRVVQGVAAGIGFIGGGVILKLEAEKRVRGLTTAASIWLTSAVGVAAGAGHLGAALVALVFSLFVLTFVLRWEDYLERKQRQRQLVIDPTSPESKPSQEDA
ncbi:MAG TPA: MgtC/SapB family protein [Abditibacteriaceae bacterium]|jgi:putative Mg2+ transporter-C (MgtC) family protein